MVELWPPDEVLPHGQADLLKPKVGLQVVWQVHILLQGLAHVYIRHHVVKVGHLHLIW